MTVRVEAPFGQEGSGSQARGRQAAGKLFLVETVDEARSVLAYLEERQLAASAVTIVGLEPAARAFLAQQGVPCIDTLAYFDNASHARALLKSEEIMQLVLRDLKPDLGDGLGEIYASSFIAPLHGRVRLMLRTIEILEGVRRAHPHSTLFICSPPAGPAGTLYQPETHLHRPEWGFLTTLGPSFCRMHGVPLEIVPQDVASRRPVRAGSPGGSTVPTGRQGWWAALSDRFVSACYLLAFKLGAGAGSVLLAPNAVGEAAVTGPLQARYPGAKLLAFRLGRGSIGQEARYALGWLLRTILHREPGDRIRTIPLDVIQDPWARDRSASAQSALAQAATQFLARNGAWFSYGGVPFLDEVQAVVRDYVLPMWLSLYRPLQAEACVLRHLRPSLALSSTSDGVTRALGELCKLQAIPAMVIPYKSLGSPKNELEVIGERQMGAFFVNDAYAYAGVQSPFAFGYLQSTAYGGQALAVGPLLRVRGDAVRR